MKSKLAKLEKVDFKEGWKDELSFDEWLVGEYGLALLAEALRIGDLEAVDRQVAVGTFKADIVLRAIGQERGDIVVENQRGVTDHRHLGKMLTYAASLDARQVVWIAEKFRDEHRAVLDWLNNHTDSDIDFTGLEVELWRVDGSNPAPKFNVVSHANEWAKISKADSELTEREKNYSAYWLAFKEYLEVANSQYANFAIPHGTTAGEVKHRASKSFCLLNTTIVRTRQEISVQVYFRGSKVHGHQLVDFIEEKHGEKLRAQLGQELKFIHSPGIKWKSGRINLPKGGVDIGNTDSWDEIHQWFLETLDKFDDVFTPIIDDIKVDEFPPAKVSDAE